MTGHPLITVATPSIPARSHMLTRALRSVSRQTMPAAAISVAIDVSQAGAAVTRQRALDAVQTPWVAFLDDDDVLKSHHLKVLYEHAMATGADFVYSWFDMINGIDPFPSTHMTEEFNPAEPIETTITTLMRTELAKEVGFRPLDRGHNTNSGEDFGMVLGCVKAGAKIRNLNAGRSIAEVDKTWFYIVHGDGKTSGNTSGLPTRGDATQWSPAE